jgi:hypothetical protein
MNLLTMQFPPTSHHFISLRSKYSPQHPVLKHSLYSFLNVRDQVSYPYRTIAKTVVLHIWLSTQQMSGMPSERDRSNCVAMTSSLLVENCHICTDGFTNHNLLPLVSRFVLADRKKIPKTEASTSLPRSHSAGNSSGNVAFLAAALPALS